MERLQRKSTKGYRLPKNTICVNRPTKWGNPFKLVGDIIYIDAGYRRKILDKWVYFSHGDIYEVVSLFEKVVIGEKFINQDAQYWSDHFSKQNISELKGKNLACFCSIDNPCHADILIKICNTKLK